MPTFDFVAYAQRLKQAAEAERRKNKKRRTAGATIINEVQRKDAEHPCPAEQAVPTVQDESTTTTATNATHKEAQILCSSALCDTPPAPTQEAATSVTSLDLLLEMSFSGATDTNVRPQQEFEEELENGNHDEDEVLVSHCAQLHQSNFVSQTGMANKYSQFQLAELSALGEPTSHDNPTVFGALGNAGVMDKNHDKMLMTLCATAKRLYDWIALYIPATPIIILRMVKTPNPARSPELNPFATREPPTFCRHMSHWTRLLVMVMRLAKEADHPLRDTIELSASIRHAAGLVEKELQRGGDLGEEAQNRILDLSMLLVTHVYHAASTNLMFGFLTSLCWSEQKGNYRKANHCTSSMAGVLFAARLLWLGDLWRRCPLGPGAQSKVVKIARAMQLPQYEQGFENDDAAPESDVEDEETPLVENAMAQATANEINCNDDCTKMIACMRETIQQLQDGTSSTISEILRLIPLGRKMQDDAPPAIQWGFAMKYLLYHGKHISLDFLRSSIRRRIQYLHEEVNKLLLFDKPAELIKLVISDLHDNPSEDAAGYSFMAEPRNRRIVEPLTRFIHDRVKASRRMRRRFFQGNRDTEGETTDTMLVPDPAEAGRYLERYYKVMQTLLSTIYLTAGAPARTTELMDLYIENGVDRQRNFYISDGDVLLYTRYWKLRSTTGFDRPVMRFLTYPVGVEFLRMVMAVRPWALFLKAALINAVPGAAKLDAVSGAVKLQRPPQFFDKLVVHGSKVSARMPTVRHLQDELSQFFANELQARIHASSYRQLFHAISKD